MERARTRQVPVEILGGRRFSAFLVFSILAALILSVALKAEIVYRNPRVYNVDFSFELSPDPKTIDRSKDLRLWVPVPREWDSQKAVKIISVQPPPHAEYEDPEHGNRMLFWDFGKEPEKPSYRVDIKFRLEGYEVHAEVDPEHVGPYDKTSIEYVPYTRSTHTVSITPKIREMAQEAVGDEKNPYLQAERIFKFVRKNMSYKLHRLERGVGTEVLLTFPYLDEKTGEEYYEGACGQYSAFFIALCRAVGLPARAVVGFVGWQPWMKEEDLELFLPIELNLSPERLAGTQHYVAGSPHVWAEFYIPACGWVPVEVTGGSFGHYGNKHFIMSKGFDVQIGPHSPGKESEGYGFQWVLLHNGTTDLLQTGVWNIAKIRIAKVEILHHSDPFPADALAAYAANSYPPTDAETKLKEWRKRLLMSIHAATRGNSDPQVALKQPWLQYQREALAINVFREIVGDSAFAEIEKRYRDQRLSSGTPVRAAQFQKIAEGICGQSLDGFFEQWLGNNELPHLKLQAVTSEHHADGWRLHGKLFQVGKRSFTLPMELSLETSDGLKQKRIRLETTSTEFEFQSEHRPVRLLVDPDYQIPSIRWMPSRLVMFWDDYPNLMVIYGTVKEAEANKKAAERFNEDYLGLDDKVIRSDIDIRVEDLNGRFVILFGRPETNRITSQFKDAFPIRFEGDHFSWQGVEYSKPTQGVAQIIENPHDATGLIILYAGLSEKSTLQICDSHLYDRDASFVVFNGEKVLVSDDWEPDGDLVWRYQAMTE